MDSRLALCHRGRVSLILKAVMISASPGDSNPFSFSRVLSLQRPHLPSGRWSSGGPSLSIQNGLQQSTGTIMGALGNLISQGHYSSAFDLGPDRSLAGLRPPASELQDSDKERKTKTKSVQEPPALGAWHPKLQEALTSNLSVFLQTC